MIKYIISIFFVFIFLNIKIFAQTDTIYLINPSFEGIPRTAISPKGWTNCHENPQIVADVHPSGVYGVQKKAVNGETYLALLTHEIESAETIGQQLPSPLLANKCYSFKISLCRTNHYKSATKKLPEDTEYNYNAPIKLAIWGGTTACTKSEKLAESNTVYNTNWLDFVFTFTPTKDYPYLILAAATDDPLLPAYDGHILIDNAAPIIPMSCDSLEKWTTNDPQDLYKKLQNAQGLILHEETLNDDSNGIKAIYYNRGLTEEKSEQAIRAIQQFAKRYPKRKANIIIEEDSKKAGKKVKKALVRRLSDLGVPAAAYGISVFTL